MAPETQEKHTCSCDGCGGHFEKVCQILADNDHRADRLIPILQAIQHEYRYLPEAILDYVATDLGVSPAWVYGVATFYAHFTLKKLGKYVIRLCDGTACHVKGSMKIYDAIAKQLGLSESKNTTDDMLFTLQTVSCLGACGLAPVMLINEDVHGQVTPQQAVELIEELKANETGQSE